MARTDSHWEKTIGGYIKAAYNVLISGTNRYLNFGTVSGASGYGIRDNAGTLEFKNDGGSWTAFGGGGGGGITTEQAVDAVAAAIAAGTHAGITITYDDAGNAIDFELSGESFTTAMKNKVDFITVTQAVDLDTMESDIAGKADSSSLATVATTGAYSDLSGTPDLSVYDNFEVEANSVDFPATGSSDVLYLESSTGLLYRWTGASYAVISAQLALGETSSTAYRGDRGKIAYDHTSATDNPHSVTKAQVGLGSVPNVDARPRSTHTGTQLASTISDFAATVRSTALTGLSTATATAVTAANSVLVAIGKLQAQINALPSKTETLTNKRVQPRVNSQASTATLTPEVDTYDLFVLTAQAAALTIANHSTSTPTDGEMIRIRVTDNSTARGISFGTNYSNAGGIDVPTTTTIDKRMEMGFEWDAGLSKYVLVALAEEA